MKKDAETHNADDQKKREETKNAAEQLIYTSEKALRDNKDKVPADVAKTIEEKISALKTAKGGSDVAAIKTASEALSAELQKIGEIMAKAAQEQTKATSAGASAADSKGPDDKGGEGNVKDAEYKEKK